MSGLLKTFKVAYIADKKRMDLVHGQVYEAFLPIDERRGYIIAIEFDKDDQRGYPASWFKLVSDPENEVPATSTIHRD